MPESALRHLTNYTMRRPTAEDILDFLTKARYNVDLADVKALVHMYDSDLDEALHNYELKSLMVSMTEPREKYYRMPMVQPVGDMHTLGAGAATQLARLMMSEIHGLRFLERDRGYLIVGRQLSSVVAFSLIKTSESNEVCKDDIFKFLTENGYSPTDKDINAIFWRLDHNKDGKLTYTDFCQIYDDSIL